MVTLPAHLDATDLLKQALTHDVAFVPGEGFYIGDAGKNTFRLNFSNSREERIVEGIKRLGGVLKAAVRGCRPTSPPNLLSGWRGRERRNVWAHGCAPLC